MKVENFKHFDSGFPMKYFVLKSELTFLKVSELFRHNDTAER